MPGDVFFTHHARSSTIAYSSFECLRLHIPRAMAPAFLRDSDVNGAVLKEGRAGTALLTRHIEGLWSSLADLAPDEIAASVDAAFVIASGSLHATMPLQPEHRQAMSRTVLRSIQSFIQDRLADPRLGPDVICAAFRISKSTLYRLFEQEGGVITHIRACRLDRCWQKLRTQGREAGPITSLAYDCGFNSDVSFSRAFRRRFGVSPREVRDSFSSAPRGSADDDTMQSIEQRILSRYRNVGGSAR
ncbi:MULTISPECIES: helix-turn-helix domain-containing protein [unclassified Bradyrhizobium]